MLHEISATASYRSYGGFIYRKSGLPILCDVQYVPVAEVAAVANQQNQRVAWLRQLRVTVGAYPHSRRPKGPNK
jgi:hypothetical protein